MQINVASKNLNTITRLPEDLRENSATTAGSTSAIILGGQDAQKYLGVELKKLVSLHEFEKMGQL